MAPASEFDQKINDTHTQECLKRLLCLYREADTSTTSSHQPYREADTSTTSSHQPYREADTAASTAATPSNLPERVSAQGKAESHPHHKLTEDKLSLELETYSDSGDSQIRTNASKNSCRLLGPVQSKGGSLGPVQSKGGSLGPDQSKGGSLGPVQSKGGSLGPVQSKGDVRGTNELCSDLEGLRVTDEGPRRSDSCDKAICDKENSAFIDCDTEPPWCSALRNSHCHKQQTEFDNQEVGGRAEDAGYCRCRQAEFVAVYLLFNLGSPDALALGFEWRPRLK